MLEKEELQGTWWQWALELISSEAEGWQQQTPVCTNTHTHTQTLDGAKQLNLCNSMQPQGLLCSAADRNVESRLPPVYCFWPSCQMFVFIDSLNIYFHI